MKCQIDVLYVVGEAVREEGEAVKRCIGIECSAKALRSIVHFASKEGMEIEGLRI